MATTPTAKPTTRPAIGGSGVTVMRWHPYNTVGKKNVPVGGGGDAKPHLIAFCRVVSITEPPAVAPPTAVQPLNEIRPTEIVTAGAQTNGTIDLTLYQLYNQQVWQRLAGLGNTTDITDVLRTIDQWGHLVITRYVQPPVPIGGTYPATAYQWDYQGCKLASIGDDMPIDVTTMVLEKDLTFWYRRYTFSEITPSPFFTSNNPVKTN